MLYISTLLLPGMSETFLNFDTVLLHVCALCYMLKSGLPVNCYQEYCLTETSGGSIELKLNLCNV